MKKMLCFLLCLTLIFSSVSLCFASPTTWDTTDQNNLRYIMQSVTSNTSGNLYYIVNNIASRLNTINNNIIDIKGLLSNSGESISYWVHSISTWMSPIYNAITNIPVDMSTIIGALGYTDTNNTYHPFLNDMYSLFAYKGLNGNNISLFSPTWDWGLTTISFSPYEDQLKNILYMNVQSYNGFTNAMAQLLKYTNHSRYYTDWASLQRIQMTNYSFGDGVLNFLDKIQQPVARLSYVLASDERIEAQEAAAANEEAVVDNFIDSSGDGSASPSDIGSVSDLSSGYKQNFGSDASVSGIFNIFDSNNMGWFSQETKNQLDTTTPTRSIKGYQSETPLLDKQIEEIYNALGVKQP